MRNILVLGHSGFIGRHVVEAFHGDAAIGAVACLSAPDLDLTEEACVGALAARFEPDTTVVFLAGIKRQWGDTPDTFDMNVAMATNVCRALDRSSIRRLVFISSAAVYGEESHDLSITESTPIQPQSFYGLAKYTIECLLSHCLRGHPQSDLVILRPPLIYGPGDTSHSYGPAGFVKCVTAGKPVVLWGDGAELREFLYVGDAARLIARFASHDCTGTYNLVSGRSHSYLDVVGRISTALGRTVTTSSRPRTKPRVDHGFSGLALRGLFPDFEFTDLSEGIRLTLSAHGVAR